MTPSKFGVLWANDPRMETFHKFMSKICVSTTIHVSRPNIVKIGHCEVAEKSSRIAYKKTRNRGHVRAPHFAPILTTTPKNSRKLSGSHAVYMYRFGPDQLRFAGLIPERVQKSQPAIITLSSVCTKNHVCRSSQKLKKLMNLGS